MFSKSKKSSKKNITETSSEKAWSKEEIKKHISHLITHPKEKKIRELLSTLKASTLSAEEVIDCLKIQGDNHLSNNLALGMTIAWDYFKLLPVYLALLQHLKEKGVTPEQFHELHQLRTTPSNKTFWMIVFNKSAYMLRTEDEKIQCEALNFFLNLFNKHSIHLLFDELEMRDKEEISLLHYIIFKTRKPIGLINLFDTILKQDAPLDKTLQWLSVNLLSHFNNEEKEAYIDFRLKLLKKYGKHKDFYYFSSHHDSSLDLSGAVYKQASQTYLLYLLELAKNGIPSEKLNKLGKPHHLSITSFVAEYVANYLMDMNLIYQVMRYGLCPFYYDDRSYRIKVYPLLCKRIKEKDMINHILTLPDSEKQFALDKMNDPLHPLGELFTTHLLEHDRKHAQAKIVKSLSPTSAEPPIHSAPPRDVQNTHLEGNLLIDLIEMSDPTLPLQPQKDLIDFWPKQHTVLFIEGSPDKLQELENMIRHFSCYAKPN